MAGRYVIIGAGQAGRRAAETLRELRADSDIVLIGDYAAALHRRQGVEVRLGMRLLGFERMAGRTRRVVTADDTLVCDAVVVGIGVQPNVEFQMLGDFHGQSAAVVRGDLDSDRFAVLAVDAAGRLVGVVTVNSGRDIAAYRRLMLERKSVPLEALADACVSLRELLAAA
ncbi:MAG TPA: oxidoreductase C-terminal domain-containing protein [Candidatus Competibacteraceae bacterium]|nr:oxidoreductase C-terminal domain-containing protein [Candidatus Competibacteraceae bacterium]